MKRKKKPSSDQSGNSSSEREDPLKKEDNKSPSFASTSFGATPALSTDMKIDSNDDFQLPINDQAKEHPTSSKRIIPRKTKLKPKQAPRLLFLGHNKKQLAFPRKTKEKASILPSATHNFQQDLDAPGPSASSYSTAVSTPAENFDAILSAMSPEEVEDILRIFQDLITSAPAPKASDKTDTDGKKVSKKVKKKIDKREELKKEEAKDSSKFLKCPTCGGTGHARFSSKNCSKRVKGKKEAFKEFTKTAVIKTSLINCCKYESVVLEIQKLVAHITQVIFAESIFANYHYIDQVQDKEVPSAINQNLIYQLFSVLTGEGYSIVISSMAKQYEAMVRENITSNYKLRTCRHLLGIFSKPDHELFCSNVLTVAQGKSIACNVFQKKANTEDCKWPFSVDENNEIKSFVEITLAFWFKFDVTGAKPSTVLNVDARPHHYLNWTHEIQRE
ncbi:hypothetical protein [Parasitella parasitica]|uniref:Uncharacterized protein n=1 Tax=Parasitella parasitica TaxID=35722 RepID=A0A0B7NBZ4_9FUNG|nr:hypothetical protein [Parasitella parasitica]